MTVQRFVKITPRTNHEIESKPFRGWQHCLMELVTNHGVLMRHDGSYYVIENRRSETLGENEVLSSAIIEAAEALGIEHDEEWEDD